MDKLAAIDLYEQAAAKGSKRAKYTLGVCYLNGDGVPVDKEKGVERLKSCAAQGYAKAQRLLQTM